MVGAGQLARMTAQAAVGLGIEFRVLAAAADESAAQVCGRTQIGDYRSVDDLLAFGGRCDVVTFDHEHVPEPHLRALEQAGLAVRPGPDALRYAQDKRAMRARLAELGVACPRSDRAGCLDDVTGFADRSGWPVVLKAVSGGYDGKGVWVCGGPEEAAEMLARLHGIDLMVEEHVAFERELAVLVARSPSGQAAVYPVVQTVQQDGVHGRLAAGRAGHECGELALEGDVLLDDQVDPVPSGEHLGRLIRPVADPDAPPVIAAADRLEDHRPSRAGREAGDIVEAGGPV